jgi:hypothetical protein
MGIYTKLLNSKIGLNKVFEDRDLPLFAFRKSTDSWGFIIANSLIDIKKYMFISDNGYVQSSYVKSCLNELVNKLQDDGFEFYEVGININKKI